MRVVLIVGGIFAVLIVGGFLVSPSLGVGALVGAAFTSVVLAVALRTRQRPEDESHED